MLRYAIISLLGFRPLCLIATPYLSYAADYLPMLIRVMPPMLPPLFIRRRITLKMPCHAAAILFSDA